MKMKSLSAALLAAGVTVVGTAGAFDAPSSLKPRHEQQVAAAVTDARPEANLPVGPSTNPRAIAPDYRAIVKQAGPAVVGISVAGTHAVDMAQEGLPPGISVAVHTLSDYLRNGATGWLAGWKRRNWLTADKQPVKNVDLWQRLEAAAARHDVEWHWVRGHAGHPENERADALARAAVAGLCSGS